MTGVVLVGFMGTGKTAVGRELGKERMQVHRWLKRYNIDLAQYRSE
jgi:predicted kinase